MIIVFSLLFTCAALPKFLCTDCHWLAGLPVSANWLFPSSTCQSWRIASANTLLRLLVFGVANFLLACALQCVRVQGKDLVVSLHCQVVSAGIVLSALRAVASLARPFDESRVIVLLK
jgi:hypothetical protein